MTISDLIARLTRIQTDLGKTGGQTVKIGKDYNEYQQCFDAFDIKVVDKEVVLVPSDVWIARRDSISRPLFEMDRGE